MFKTVSLNYVLQITASTEPLLNIRVDLSPTIYNFVPALAISWNFGCHMANNIAHIYS